MKQHHIPARHSSVPVHALLILATACAQLTAQSTGPVLAPATLSFTTQAGSSPPGQTIAVSSSGASSAFSATAISTGNWLSVSPASVTAPGNVTVSVNSQSLTAGTYGGFVQVSSSDGNSTVAPVTLSVTASGLMLLTAVPPNLTVDFPAGATSPISRDIVLSTTGMQAGSVSTTVTTSSPMLSTTVSPTSPAISPTTPATVSVSISPTGLTPGRYYAALAFGAPGTGGTLSLITVNVGGTGGGGMISASPTQVALNGQLGSTNPISQSLQLSASGSSPVAFTVTSATTSCGAAWLSVSPTSGSTPATLSVQANPGALPAGSCQGSVSILANGSTTPLTIPVSLTLSAGANLTVPATGPNFTYQVGGTAPTAQSIAISSSGNPLAFTAAVSSASSGSPVFLSASPLTGTTPANLQLSINSSALSGLAAGTYTNTLTITSPSASNSPQSIPVTLTVSASGSGGTPTLSIAPASADFVFQIGQSAPAAQQIQISSSGTPVQFSVASATTACSGFFSVSPQTGSTVEIGADGKVTPGVITITPNVQGLNSASTCSGTVSVTLEGSTAAPLTIPVSMSVVANNVLTATPIAIQAIALAGSPTPNTQIVSVKSTTASMPLNFTASVVTDPPAQTWLSVTPASSQTPADLVVNMNQSGLQPGVYQASIRLSTGGTSPAQTIPVRFTVVGNLLTPTPGMLTFTQAVGGALPVEQSINLGILPPGSNVTATATALNGSGWLSVNAPAGQSNLSVRVNSSGLSEGLYRGLITIQVPGSAPSPLYVPVTFTYGTPSALEASSSTLSFSYTAGSSTTPNAQTVQITTSGQALPFTVATASASGGNFFSVTPTSGTTPGALSVTLNQAVIANLAAGSYSGTITVTSPNSSGARTIAVNLSVSEGPAPGTPTVSSILNLGTNQSGVAPGTIVTLTGTGLGPTTPASIELTPEGLVQTTLANTTVTIDGVPAPLLMVSGTQINAIVPYEVAGKQSVPVVVSRTVSGTTLTSQTTALPITSTAPGIITFDPSGTGQGAILNQSGTVNGTADPAAPGSIIVVYATGEGLLTPPATTGSVTSATGTSFPMPVATVSATVGGSPATVLYAGSAPGLIAGLLQVNLRMPSNLSSGPQPVVLTIGGVSSRTGVTVAVQ